MEDQLFRVTGLAQRQASPPGQELIHFAGLQQLWTGHLPPSRPSGRKVKATFVWRDGNGRGISYFLGEKSLEVSEEPSSSLGNCRGAMTTGWSYSWGPHPSSHPLSGVRKGDEERKRVEERSQKGDR